MSSTCVKSDLRRICLQALPTKFSVCLFPDDVCIQQVSLCPSGCQTYQILLLSTTWFYPVAFKQSNQWLQVNRVSFCQSCFMKISMLRIGFVQIYQVPRLLKKILRSSATIKIIPRIILANCSYFKAKDCGTPCCPLSFRLLTWLINWNPTKKLRVWVTDLDLKSTKRQIIIGLLMDLLDVGNLREECW